MYSISGKYNSLKQNVYFSWLKNRKRRMRDLYNVTASCKVWAYLVASGLAITIPCFKNTAFNNQISHFNWLCLFVSQMQ